jgi:hypothetical protein
MSCSVVICSGGQAPIIRPPNARAPSLSQGIDPHQMMMKASAMPVTEFVDYSLVFVH